MDELFGVVARLIRAIDRGMYRNQAPLGFALAGVAIIAVWLAAR